METIETKKNLLEIARGNFQKWNEALQTQNAEKVAELYSKDATFHPTMSEDFKLGQEGAKEYFEHFLLKNPVGKITNEEIQSIDGNTYIHSGFYDFEVGPNDKRGIVEARFTYVWQKGADGQWRVIHHHSSIKPAERKDKITCPNCKYVF